MPLHEDAARLLADVNAGVPPVNTLTPTEARRVMAETRMRAAPIISIELPRVEDREIPGPAGPLRVRVYHPSLQGPKPVVVYFHGGGWVLCDLESHDPTCRRIASDADCIVVSVDYRLAPEHPYPAAVEDAFAATAWVADNATTLGADAERLAVAGDSAGGNLAAVIALLARDRGGPAIAFQVLVYPVTNCDFSTASYREDTGAGTVDQAAMRWYWRHYLGADGDGDAPTASPLRADDLRGLPPALIVTAEVDPLRDEGEAYAARLQAAGVPATSTRYEGMFHGFLGYIALEAARAAHAQMATALRAALHRGT